MRSRGVLSTPEPPNIRGLNSLFGVFFPILMGLPMSWRVHFITSDMKRHLPWFTDRSRTVLLINIVLLLAGVNF